MRKKTTVRTDLLKMVEKYFDSDHRKNRFVPGETLIQYAGRVYDKKDMTAMVSAVLDFWLTYGEYCKKFEKLFSEFHSVKDAILVNSGSSANLLAISTILSGNLKGGLTEGAEVITPALTFPTTVAPIVQNGLVPVFVDVNSSTYNIDTAYLKDALSKKTKAIFIPHTLGNPCKMDVIMKFAEKHGLYVIEDACDALGSRYNGKLVGTFGNIGTFSFYPAHHITMGEGGAVITNDPGLSKTARSIREWGRTCSSQCIQCKYSNKLDGHCALRFTKKWKYLPEDYDKRYVYSHIGYNLKALDIQAALGIEQLAKFNFFARRRNQNFKKLYNGLKQYAEFLSLPLAEPESEPVWFAMPITLRENKQIARRDLVLHLENKKIETRPIFAGNILRQPGYHYIKYRKIGELKNADFIMRNGFFIGVYPGIEEIHTEYILEQFASFFQRYGIK